MSQNGYNRKRGGGQISSAYRPMADINMTPFIDVMMVLLIIFMVAAPLMTSGVEVDLPRADAAPVEMKTEPITITVTDDGTLYLGESEVGRGELLSRLEVIVAGGVKEDQRLLLRGDKNLNYGSIMDVMSLLTTSGYTRIALVAEKAR